MVVVGGGDGGRGGCGDGGGGGDGQTKRDVERWAVIPWMMVGGWRVGGRWQVVGGRWTVIARWWLVVSG